MSTDSYRDEMVRISILMGFVNLESILSNQQLIREYF